MRKEGSKRKAPRKSLKKIAQENRSRKLLKKVQGISAKNGIWKSQKKASEGNKHKFISAFEYARAAIGARERCQKGARAMSARKAQVEGMKSQERANEENKTKFL